MGLLFGPCPIRGLIHVSTSSSRGSLRLTTSHLRESFDRPSRGSPRSGSPRIFRSPIAQRRWRTFKANRRARWSLWLFLRLLRALTLLAEVIVNDQPLVVSYKGELLFPVLHQLSEVEVRGLFLAVTRLSGPVYPERGSTNNGWLIWPAVRYSLPDDRPAISPVSNPASRRPGRCRRKSAACANRSGGTTRTARSAISIGSAPTTRAATSSPASFMAFAFQSSSACC